MVEGKVMVHRIIRNESTAATQKIWKAVDQAAARAPHVVIQRIQSVETTQAERDHTGMGADKKPK